MDYLPIVRQDLIQIARYIGKELGDPIAADRAVVDLLKVENRIQAFPYANPAYIPI